MNLDYQKLREISILSVPAKKNPFQKQPSLLPQELSEEFEKPRPLISLKPKQAPVISPQYFEPEIKVAQINQILSQQVRDLVLDGASLGEQKRLSSPEVDAWITRTGIDNFEIEIIGNAKGHGTRTTVFEAQIINLTLKLGRAEKTTRPIAIARFSKEHAARINEAVKLLKKCFLEPDPDLRIVGCYSHMDRTIDGEVEARDILMRGDLSKEFSKLSSKQKFQVLQDIAVTLSKLHEKGLVHRDIKPDNLFVGQDGRGYIGDLEGLSGYLRQEEEKADIGTPGYLGRGPGPLSDIYALAASTEFLYRRQNPFWAHLEAIEEAENSIYSISKQPDFKDSLEDPDSNIRKEAYKKLKALFPQYEAFTALFTACYF